MSPFTGVLPRKLLFTLQANSSPANASSLPRPTTRRILLSPAVPQPPAWREKCNQQSSLLHLSLWEPQPSFSLWKAPSSGFPSSLQKMSSECSCVRLSSPSWQLPVSFSDEVKRVPRPPQLLSACSGVTVPQCCLLLPVEACAFFPVSYACRSGSQLCAAEPLPNGDKETIILIQIYCEELTRPSPFLCIRHDAKHFCGFYILILKVTLEANTIIPILQVRITTVEAGRDEVPCLSSHSW